MARVLQDDLRPDGVFLDVGSHFGIWSVYAAGIVGKTGKVFAFEPSPVLGASALVLRTGHAPLTQGQRRKIRRNHVRRRTFFYGSLLSPFHGREE